jgi:hypothetical protein
MPTYKALVGFNYKPNRQAGEQRIEAGDTVSDLPLKVVKYLQAEQAIDEVKEPKEDQD